MSEKALLPSRTQFSFSMKRPVEDSDESDNESVCVSSYFDDKDGKFHTILCFSFGAVSKNVGNLILPQLFVVHSF